MPRPVRALAFCTALTIVPASLALTSLATAQPQPFGCQESAADPVRCFDLQTFLPTPSTGSTFSIERPAVLRHLAVEMGLAMSASFSVLGRQTASDSADLSDLAPVLAQGELLGAIGLFERLEVGVALPVAYIQRPEAGADLTAEELATSGKLGLSDLRISAKVPLLWGDFALAVRGLFSLPTGNSDEFLSTGYWGLMPGVLASGRVGPVTIAGDLGYRFRRLARLGNLVQDDEIQAGLGARWDLLESFAVVGETQARFGVGDSDIQTIEIPWEINAGVRWRPAPAITADIGIGRGLTSGYGAPGFRVFGIVRYATEPELCSQGPEDHDGFEDGDFCRDPDNDADGIEDELDQCPNDPEDRDSFRDEDGCPDEDNDADGLADAEDACPRVSEDFDGFEDADGCPEDDNDADGITDGLDACPFDPEDHDQFQDEDGCPEPGPGQATVRVTERRILISERIYFDHDRDTIRAVSQPLLDQVAEAIGTLGGRRTIRVDGYTDSAGDETYNRDLSFRRARAVVQYLVGKGVRRARLTFEGYGEENPVAPNDTPAGRALNRRVEFTIVSR